jgi:hypothetical protein
MSELPETLQERWTKAWDACVNNKQKKEKREKIALMTSEFVHGQEIEWKEINYDHYGRVESTISRHGKIERINERNEDVTIFDVLNDDRTMTQLKYGTFLARLI